METEYMAGILIVLVLIISVVSIIFFMGDRIESNNDQSEDYMKYGNIFSSRAEICEKYGMETIDETDFFVILASIAHSDCRALTVFLDFSMNEENFEQGIEDIYPKGKTPPVIYRDLCQPLEKPTGSYIVSTGFGRYVFRKGDRIDIKVLGEMTKDVMICLVL